MTETRKYRIIRCDLWYNIYKKLKKDNPASMWYLWPNCRWVLNKNHAKVFYHQWDAESALTLVRIKDKWGTPTTSTKKSESEEVREKKSWSEL